MALLEWLMLIMAGLPGKEVPSLVDKAIVSSSHIPFLYYPLCTVHTLCFARFTVLVLLFILAAIFLLLAHLAFIPCIYTTIYYVIREYTHLSLIVNFRTGSSSRK